VTGSVVGIDLAKPSFSVKARSGDVFEALVGPTTWYQMLTNLDKLGRDRVPDPEGGRSGNGVRDGLKRYIQVNRPVTVSGVICEDDEKQRYEARAVYLFGSQPDAYVV